MKALLRSFDTEPEVELELDDDDDAAEKCECEEALEARTGDLGGEFLLLALALAPW